MRLTRTKTFRDAYHPFKLVSDALFRVAQRTAHLERAWMAVEARWTVSGSLSTFKEMYLPPPTPDPTEEERTEILVQREQLSELWQGLAGRMDSPSLKGRRSTGPE